MLAAYPMADTKTGKSSRVCSNGERSGHDPDDCRLDRGNSSAQRSMRTITHHSPSAKSLAGRSRRGEASHNAAVAVDLNQAKDMNGQADAFRLHRRRHECP